MGREVRREGDPWTVPSYRDWRIAFAFLAPFSVFFNALFRLAFLERFGAQKEQKWSQNGAKMVPKPQKINKFYVFLRKMLKNLCTFTISHLKIKKNHLFKTSRSTSRNHSYHAGIEKTANSCFSWIELPCRF